MCSPVGWAGKVSESVRFRIKINTILAEDHFGISPESSLHFLTKGSHFDASTCYFCLRGRIFDALFDAGVALLLPQTVWGEHLGRSFFAKGMHFRRLFCARGCIFDALNGSGVHFWAKGSHFRRAFCRRGCIFVTPVRASGWNGAALADTPPRPSKTLLLLNYTSFLVYFARPKGALRLSARLIGGGC